MSDAPDFSAEAFERTLARVNTMAAGYLRNLRDREAFRRPPDEVVRRFETAPLPLRGSAPDGILDEIARDVLPYALGIGHPRWWGFVRPSADPFAIATDLLATTMNNNCAGSAQIATFVEMTVMRWLAELVGYPPTAGGILVSGGSAANFVALAAMREAMLPGTRERGLVALHERPIVYASPEAHSCLRRALEMLGFGRDSLHLVGTDAELRMDVGALEARIAEDRAAGRRPICLIASAGTVNTGVVDPLAALRDLAKQEGMWFHIDGAYGAVGAALPELAARYRGLAEADSLALDPHKWLYVPYEAGGVLVRNRDALTRAFATHAEYLEVRDEDWFNGPLWFHQQGPQLSRGFRALKLWALMRHLGVEGLRTLWRRDIAAARQMRQIAEAHPKLEPVAVSDLSVCCFRYDPVRGDADRFNERLVNRIQRDGRLFVAGTTVAGVFCLRACIINFRTTPDDVAMAMDAVVELGAELERTDPST